MKALLPKKMFADDDDDEEMIWYDMISYDMIWYDDSLEVWSNVRIGGKMF